MILGISCGMAIGILSGCIFYHLEGIENLSKVARVSCFLIGVIFAYPYLSGEFFLSIRIPWVPAKLPWGLILMLLGFLFFVGGLEWNEILSYFMDEDEDYQP